MEFLVLWAKIIISIAIVCIFAYLLLSQIRCKCQIRNMSDGVIELWRIKTDDIVRAKLSEKNELRLQVGDTVSYYWLTGKVRKVQRRRSRIGVRQASH